MADVDNGDVLRIGATMSFETTFEITNVWHALVTAGGGIGYAAAALDAQAYMASIYALLQPKLVNTQTTDFLTLSNPTKGTTFGAIAWAAPITGAQPGDCTAPGVCGFAWARTLVPRVQIRKYFGVFAEIDMQAGVWSSTLRSAMNAAMNVHIGLYTGGPALSLQGVAFNRTTKTAVVPLTATTSNEPAYQRRRKRGRGS